MRLTVIGLQMKKGHPILFQFNKHWIHFIDYSLLIVAKINKQPSSHFNINPIIAIAKAEEISEEMDCHVIFICPYIMASTLVFV